MAVETPVEPPTPEIVGVLPDALVADSVAPVCVDERDDGFSVKRPRTDLRDTEIDPSNAATQPADMLSDPAVTPGPPARELATQLDSACTGASQEAAHVEGAQGVQWLPSIDGLDVQRRPFHPVRTILIIDLTMLFVAPITCTPYSSAGPMHGCATALPMRAMFISLLNLGSLALILRIRCLTEV